MYCSSCGKEIGNDSAFCKHCGRAIENTYESTKIEQGTAALPNGIQQVAESMYTVTFPLGVEIVEFSSDIKKYTQWRKNLYPIFDRAKNEYYSWYEENCENLIGKDTLIEESMARAGQIISKMVAQVVSVLFAYGIHYMSTESFCQKYMEDYFNYPAYIEPIYDAYIKIIAQKEEMEAYLQYKKANRSRWVGGGFGVAGAMKGAMTAGAMNMVSGAFRGVGAMVERSRSDSRIRAQKKALFEEETTTFRIKEGMTECLKKIIICAEMELERKGEFYCPQLDQKQSSILLKNALSRTTNEAQFLQIIREAIICNPYNTDIYRVFFVSLRNPRQDIYDIGVFFGFEELIKQIVLSEFQEETKYSALNSGREVAQMHLNMLNQKLGKIGLDLSQSALTKSKISGIVMTADIKNAAKKLDYLTRTVDGIYFESEEECEQYVQEKVKFERFAAQMEGRTTTEKQELINAQNFISKPFIEKLKREEEKNKFEEFSFQWISCTTTGGKRKLLETYHFDSPSFTEQLRQYQSRLCEEDEDRETREVIKKYQSNFLQIDRLGRSGQFKEIRESIEQRKQSCIITGEKQGQLNEIKKELVCIRKDSKERAHEMFKLLVLAQDNYPKAQFVYGNQLDSEVLRMIFFAQAAMNGYAPAQRELGVMYQTGKLGDKAPQLAILWVSLAAEQEDPTAEFLMGKYFEYGLVERNMELATFWMRRAATHGVQGAQEFLSGL